MAVRIRDAHQVTVYKDLSRYTCQVGATQLSNGDVVVVYNEARGMEHLDFDSIMLVRSRDGGESWDPATRTVVWPCTHHFGSDTPSIVQLSDGTLMVNFVMTAFVGRKGILEDFGPQSENLGAMREADGVGVTRSADGGRSWEPAYKASVSPLRYGQPVDGVLELPNGTLLMAVLGQLNARSYHAEEEPWRCALLRSDNRGLDWEHWSTIAFDPAGIISFDEPALSRTRDGVLVCMMRTEHQPRSRHQHLWIAHSRDDGESWSRPEPTRLWGYPADLTLLRDGRMLCTYGYRRPPWGVRCCISEDGLHWDPENEFVVREGGVAPDGSGVRAGWHIGYPSSVQLADGRIFTVDHQWTQEPPYVQFVAGVLYEIA